jgi:putative ABC transport system permease protein
MESQWNARVSNMIANSIYFIALALAAVGLYAVTAHAVVQRRQELGIRTALGARTMDLVGIVAYRALIQLTFGIGAGVLCILLWERVFNEGVSSARYHMSDPMTLLAVSAVLLVVAVLASIAPAWRAAHVDPVLALRSE